MTLRTKGKKNIIATLSAGFLSAGFMTAALLGSGLYQAPPASAQTPLLKQQLGERQRAADMARLRAQEAAAHKSGHYNAVFWNHEETRRRNYWKSTRTETPKTAENPKTAFRNRQYQHSDATYNRTRAAAYAKIQAQEAAARRKGNYNAAYWKSIEDRNALYWSRKGSQQENYWKTH